MGGKPRKEIPLGSDYVLAIRKWAELEQGDRYREAALAATFPLVWERYARDILPTLKHGTIRTHQERRYPGRPIATALTSPDFVGLAESFGMRAERTTSAPETLAALQRSIGADVASLVHLVTD